MQLSQFTCFDYSSLMCASLICHCEVIAYWLGSYKFHVSDMMDQVSLVNIV